jgi:HSP20 family molecular chaperone IbpA
VRDEEITAQSIKFSADGIEGSEGVTCIRLPKAPKSVTADGVVLDLAAANFEDGVLRVRFANRVEPVKIEITR